MRILLALIITLSCTAQLRSQDTLRLDSVLSYGTYLAMVRAGHPVAASAEMELDLADRNLTMSRGGFDPLIYGNYRAKEYSNTEYYDALQAGIEIPTWMGISLQAGFEENEGVYLNPEETVPAAGLINAGITAQLGAGLLMDSRRAALRQAQIGLEQGQVARQLLLNALFYESTAAYFQWAFADRALEVAEEAVDLATVRYRGVVESFIFGDVPAIDTVEAYTQVLDRLYRLRQAQSNWVEAVNFASVYLWDGEGNQLIIPPGTVPENIATGETYIEDIPVLIQNQHPELRKLFLKGEFLDIDRRLAAEKLRPKIELKYNFLTENISPAPANDYFNDAVFFENNYNFGAKVSFPLFLREARGKVAMTKLKIDLVDLEYLNKEALLQAKLNSLLVKLANLQDQIGFYRQNVALLQRLLEGERELFRNGESSLFLINARETKLIDSQIVLFDLIAKEPVLRSEIRVVAGEGFPDNP